ncbi:MAG: transporter substrate-binding domain-containing protein [Proteobacteria bacterium]|nr:transporter substrate-binding domain-containing protein [Pseudomonadota bacterium]
MIKFKALVLVVSFFAIFHQHAYADEIRLRADTWPPFNASPTSALPGYMVEVAKIVFEKVGHKIDYQIAPWNRSILDAEKGNIDGIIAAAVGDAPKLLFPSEPLGRVEEAIFVKANNPWKYTDSESLKTQKIGIISDYSYGDKFDEYIKANKEDKAKIEVLAGDEALNQSIKKLSLGRVTAIFCVPQVFYQTVNDLKINKDDFIQAGSSGDKDDLFIAFSPAKESSKKYAEILSNGINELRASGELKKILDKYELKDWK